MRTLTLVFVLIAASAALDDTADDAPTPLYVRLNDTRVACICQQELASKNVRCRLLEAKNSSAVGFDCKELPFKIISSLSIDCGNFTLSSEIDLHEMTFRHEHFYPPYHVELIGCRIHFDLLSFGQLIHENVSTHESVELAMFGPIKPRLAAQYTERLEYNTSSFKPSSCKLMSLVLRSCIVVYFPIYLNMKCFNLVNMQLIDTPLNVISVSNMVGAMSLQQFTVSHSNLTEAAENIYDIVLDSLNHYLDDAIANGTVPLRNETDWLVRLKKQYGRFTWQKMLFKASDESTTGGGFTFSFAKRRIRDESAESEKWELIPSQLATLNFSYNRLTKIPNLVSLLGNLRELDLSHNEISSLYDYDMCWPPSYELARCYWFRGPKDSLRKLDLSYNRIPFIGVVSPWFEVNLQYLDLSHNRIKSLNAMAFNNSLLPSSLVELNLDYNWLQSFELASLARLEKLWVRNNDLKVISLRSIPQSPFLTFIGLNDNLISDIDCGCFVNLTSLRSLDLRSNSIKVWNADYFMMSNRTNQASRVMLYISGQKVTQLCTCNHVYAVSEIELQKHTKACSEVYKYPQFSYNETRDYHCEFFMHENVTQKTNKSLRASTPSNFICPYYGYIEVEVPRRYCFKNSSTGCRTRCISSCLCWHSRDWSYADINCDNMHADPFNFPIRIPVKKLSLNRISMIGIAGKFSVGMLRWAKGKESPSTKLRYLSMCYSHILEIEDHAFNLTRYGTQYNIEVLELRGNRLRIISQFTFSGLEKTLSTLDLSSNLIRPFDMNIFKSFSRLSNLTLRGNAWVCSCRSEWLTFQQQLINISVAGQFVSDFSLISCSFNDSEFNKAYREFLNSGWSNKGLPLNLSAPYSVDDGGKLRKLCAAMETYQEAMRQATVKWMLITVASILGSLLLLALITKRHKVYGAVEMFFILKYMQRKRLMDSSEAGALARCGNGDEFEFDVFFLADQQDESTLVGVLRDLDSAFRFYRLSSSHSMDYAVHRGSGFMQQTRFESVSDGVRFSRTVVVLLSKRFLHSGFHDLLQAVSEISASGRNPADYIVLLKLSRGVSSEHEQLRHSYGRQVSGAVAALFSRSVKHGSIDWEYKVASLVCRAKFNRAVAAGPALKAFLSPGGEATNDEETDEMAAATATGSREGASLLGDVCAMDLASQLTQPGQQPLPEWPPHSGGYGCDVLLLALPAAPEEASADALLRAIIAECSSRRLLLASCQQSLVNAFPDTFERVLAGASEAAKPRFLKCTRQFVILLTPSMARWFQEDNHDNRRLLDNLIELQQVTRVTRRILVFLDDRLSADTADSYRRLADRNLPESVTPGNHFRLAEAAESANEGQWKRALYLRTADRTDLVG
ncbi:hypothetical protein BOX15_Mlig015932g1 [Macrostomum lignano]|uniref:TIR domain-containing protein n=1 Tax=Macrostomum lignano TaxID=282301 RepID=A0A267F0V0_9PLAT|nr:hypothetical protein BOX15_Mlig015932g1 [Macrostomum lignano]